MKAKSKKFTALILTLCMAISLTVTAAFAKDIATYEIYGSPKTVSDVRSHNSIECRTTLQGGGSVCWLKIDYGVGTEKLKVVMTVKRSLGLYIDHDTVTLSNTKKGTSVTTRWDDGATYIATAATGTSYINNTKIVGLTATGWV